MIEIVWDSDTPEIVQVDGVSFLISELDAHLGRLWLTRKENVE